MDVDGDGNRMGGKQRKEGTKVGRRRKGFSSGSGSGPAAVASPHRSGVTGGRVGQSDRLSYSTYRIFPFLDFCYTP
jgi:hypothetical protein